MVRAGSGRREASRKDFRPWLRRDAGEPPVSAAEAAPEPEPVAPDSGLSLARLLSIARLTPAQAVALATDVFTALEKRGGDRAGPIPLRIDTVHVGADGHADLVEDDAPVPVKGSAAHMVLDELTAAAWRPTTDSDRPTTGPVAALDQAAAKARLPDASVAAVASLLREADTASGSEARTELARMVSAVNGGALAPPHPPLTSSAPPIAPRPPRPQRRHRSLARALAGRTWKWVLSVVVLVTVVVIEIALLRDTITRDIETVLEAGRSGSAAPTTSTQAFLPVAPAAPTAAGTVTGVDLRAVNQCTPDAECPVRLQVALQPTAEPQTVTWGFQVFDRCTGATTTVPGGEVTVPPDGDRAVAVVSVALPPGEALAVLARTDLPSTAASAPVLVPSEASCGTPAAEPSG
jgi:hypothetical protein